MKTGSGQSFTCHALHDKERRSLCILELIRKKGPISRTDISKSAGINVVSVSNYVNNFIGAGLVLEKGLAVSSGGRKPELVELNRAENFVIGIDVCRTGATAMVSDIGVNVIAKNSVQLPAVKREAANSVLALVDGVLKSAGIAKEKVRAAGLSVCDEALLYVRDAVEARLGVRALVGNAPTCGAYAEKRLNAAADADKLLYVHSDLGKGVMIDGDICTGCDGGLSGRAPRSAAAGAPSEAEKARYLEPWTDYLGVAESAVREVSRGVGTKMVSLLGGNGIEAMTVDIVIEAARARDDTALNIIESVAITLGLRIAYLINLYRPQAVVLGGGLEKAADISLPFIVKMVQKLSLRECARTVKIVPAALGDEALCLGAAALAAREVFLSA